MATEIEIDTIINTDRSEQGLGKLRTGLKELISLQGQVGQNSDQFKKLQKAINDTEGKIGDLTDSFQTLKGSGVERLNSSIGLLREGFASADTGKFKIALEGVGAAMKAIPIFLLLEGAKLLYENFGKLLSVFNNLNPAMQENARVTQELVGRTNDLGVSIAATTTKYDTQIKFSQAAGYDQLEILDLQVKKYDELQKSFTKQAAAYKDLYMLGGEASAEFYDKSLRFEQRAKDATIDGAATLLAIDKLKADRAIQAQKDHDAKLKQIAAEKEAEIKSYNERMAYIAAQDEKERLRKEAQKALDNQALIESRAKEQTDLFNETEESILWGQSFQDSLTKQTEYGEKERLEIKKRAADEEKRLQELKYQTNDNYFNAVRVLSEAFFMNQINQAKGNFKAEQKAKENAFKVDKAFAIARAIIDGVRAVQSASLVQPYPVGAALAISQAAITAANIAKIASTKFTPGSAPSDTSVNSGQTGGVSGGNFGSTPTQQIPGAGSSAFNPTGLSNVQTDKKKESQRVYVLESDIRNVTNRVNVIESRATFG